MKRYVFVLVFLMGAMSGAREVFGQARTEVIGPYGNNWYMGGIEMSCSAVCSSKGLMCSGTSWNDTNTCENGIGLMAMIGKSCSCKMSTYLVAPFVNENVVVNVNTCYFRGTDNPNADCVRVPTGNQRRLCQCTSAYTFDPKVEFSGLNATVGVGKPFDVSVKVTNVGTTQTSGNIVIKLYKNDVEITQNTFGLPLGVGASYVFTRGGEVVDAVGTVRYRAEINLAGDADTSNNTVSKTVVVVSWASPTPEGGCSQSYGDANKDGAVNIQDGFIWYQSFKGGYNLSADFNCDNVVNIQDGFIWYRYWKNPSLIPTNTPVPLPSTISCGSGVFCSDVGAQWCCAAGQTCGMNYPDCDGEAVTPTPVGPGGCVNLGENCGTDLDCCVGTCEFAGSGYECTALPTATPTATLTPTRTPTPTPNCVQPGSCITSMSSSTCTSGEQCRTSTTSPWYCVCGTAPTATRTPTPTATPASPTCLNLGDFCTHDIDCCSGLCEFDGYDDVCVQAPTSTPVPPNCTVLGDPCVYNSDCCSGFCDFNGFGYECAYVPTDPTQTAMPPPP